MEEKLYDLSQLESIASGNNDFVKKMLNMFLAQTPGLVSRIGVGVQTKDWAEVKSAAHQIKPSLDLLGIKLLHDLIRELESNAKTETNLETMKVLYDKLNTILMKVYVQLKKIL